MSSNGNQIPSHSPGISEVGIRVTVHAQVMSLIILESCHCTWIFDSRHLRFCQILKGLEVGDRRASTEWRPVLGSADQSATRELYGLPQRIPITSYLVVASQGRLCGLQGGSHDRTFDGGHSSRRCIVQSTRLSSSVPGPHAFPANWATQQPMNQSAERTRAEYCPGPEMRDRPRMIDPRFHRARYPRRRVALARIRALLG